MFRFKRSSLWEAGISMLVLLVFLDVPLCAIAFPRTTHTGFLAQRLWPFGGLYVNLSAPRATVLKSGEKFEIVFRHSDTELELRKVDPDWDRGMIATVACWPWPHTSGLFATVISSYRTTVDIESRAGPLASEDEVLIRAAYLDALERDWVARRVIWPGFLTAARAGETTATRVSVGWLVHDVVMTAMTLMVMTVVVSLTLDAVVPSARARRRRERNAAKLATGLCPSCGYSITVLAQGEGHRCPECGRELVP